MPRKKQGPAGPGKYSTREDLPQNPPVGNSDLHRFWAKVSINENGCWEWTATKIKEGYGRFWFRERLYLAHRAAYEMFIGPIPEGLTLDHLCRNRGCANPFHTEPVTQAENVRRGMSPSALCAQKTHCVNGHEFTPENTRLKADDGSRVCRVCSRRHGLARYYRNKEKALA